MSVPSAGCRVRAMAMQVMRMWPFKQLLLRSGAGAAAKYALPCRHLHHFGDMQALRQALQLTNLLTGCARGGRAGRQPWGRGPGSLPACQGICPEPRICTCLYPASADRP